MKRPVGAEPVGNEMPEQPGAADKEPPNELDEQRRAEAKLRRNEPDFRLIVDNIPTHVAVLSPTGSPELSNRQILDYTGKTMDELMQWGTSDLVHPDDLPRAVEIFSRGIGSGEPFEIVFRMRRHDGVYRWFQGRHRPVRDVNGRVVRWVVANNDIDDAKHAENALRVSEGNLKRLTETIPEMLWSATPDGMIDYCNARLLDYSGLSAAEIVEHGWPKVLHPDDSEPTVRAWENCITTGAPYQVEVRMFHASDRIYRWCVISALPLLDRQGTVVKWYGTVVDMHDWKEAQEQLHSTQAALAHVSRVTTMGELTASIAHEVNQPLAGIITNASTCLRMLAADPPNIEGARETARRTIRDGNRASDVITRLRALFSKRELTLEPVDLNEAAREVIALLGREMQQAAIVIRPDLADELPLVSGDRIQLQQVVLNLLRNAADAMIEVHDGPRHVVVKTELEKEGRVRLVVKDTGIGIGSESTLRLFEPFYTTKPNGMGIGLSVCRSIIESHRGRLWAEPNDGPGTAFSFSLPCRSNEARDLPTRTGSPAPSESLRSTGDS
jgi:PAS domain S-box-containing protein